MIIMGSKVNTRKHTTSETINWALHIINNNNKSSSSSRKCNQSVIKSADCCVKSRKKTHALGLSELLLCFFVTTSFIFFKWKIVFYNLIWSFNRDVACLFSIFVSPSIQLCLRSDGIGLFFPRKFDSITWQTLTNTHTRENSFWRPVEPIKFYL